MFVLLYRSKSRSQTLNYNSDVLTSKAQVRVRALQPVNFAVHKLIRIAKLLAARDEIFWVGLSRKVLYVAELLDLLNRPSGKLKTLFNPTNAFVFCYLVFFILFFNRLGKKFLPYQLILTANLDLFELERRCWAENLNVRKDLIPEFTSEILQFKDTIQENILFHLKIFPIQNFFQIFREQIAQADSLKPHDVYQVGQEVANYLHSIGSFSVAEQVEIFIKETCDTKYGRLAGIRRESNYFTAVGHMSLMGFLIMAKKVDLIKKCEVSVLVDESNFSNSVFAKILIGKAEEVGFQIISAEKSGFAEPDLELYPVNSKDYKIARYCYSSIFREFESRYAHPFLNFKDVDQKIIILAEEILDKFGITDFSKLVGIHIREDQPLKQANRNSDFERYLDSLDWLESVGYTVVRLGHAVNKGKWKLGLRSVDATQLPISRYEQEALNLYLWSKAHFFIGNLSGGTFPPSLFGVPTLYVDVFPYTHMTLPGMKDLLTPKRLFNYNKQKYLSWEDSFAKSNTHLQIENPLRLVQLGYELTSYSSQEMLTCVKKFITSLDIGIQKKSSRLGTQDLDSEDRLIEFNCRLNLPY